MNADEELGKQDQGTAGVTRRGLLKNGLAVAGSVAALGAAAASAGVDEARPYSPLYAQTGDSVGGRKFRAWVSRGEGPGRTTLQEMSLRPIGGRQVVVRTEAANLCYTLSPTMLGINRSFNGGRPLTPQQRARRDRFNNMATVQGHGGVGTVEAIGPEVRRVKVGDRVCVSGTPQCGVCYACVRGRSDMCQFLGPANMPEGMTPVADMRDGTPVYMNSQIGGFGEYMVTVEEWVVPIITKAQAQYLEVACACTSVAGLGATTSQGIAVLPPAAKVGVVGCGPLGLSAIQGARIAGAKMIIGVDPIRVRREAAMKVGATHVLDPNEEGDHLVDRVRELTSEENPSMWGGGIYSAPFQAGGADFVIEAAGGEWLPPALERGPDPTGLLPMQQAYDMLHGTGHAVLTSLAFGNLSFNAGVFALAGRSVHAGQAGGCSPLRDIPKFVSFLDNGTFDPKPLLTAPIPLEKVLDTYQEVARRATILAVLVV